MANLGIVIASTRPGRVGPAIAQWFEKEAREQGGFDEIDLIDLAEVALPFMNEPNHPRLGNYTYQHTLDWSARVAGVDAFVFVMPEYNHGFNAELKNAIDYLHAEWQHKPVGFVSYGGPAAGTRAVQMLKPVLSALKMTPLPEAVNIPFFFKFLDTDKGFVPDEFLTNSAVVMLGELVRVEGYLSPLRTGPATPATTA
ncbi:NADPH-dependent FMN reductase [Streptomyces justiciae]|uniref:NADPH-dependent FMN reductase n=1 Tax=Streptomyces justiciae TaxID=2780140 RepID=UPI002117E889|nr:NAD(P)H-dependent oxidoreductase [Streptomyces justiciae]MCW8378720.1 NAD(P)H-dependent oxidoreductase [Streptomyces justiciae]